MCSGSESEARFQIDSMYIPTCISLFFGWVGTPWKSGRWSLVQPQVLEKRYAKSAVEGLVKDIHSWATQTNFVTARRAFKGFRSFSYEEWVRSSAMWNCEMWHPKLSISSPSSVTSSPHRRRDLEQSQEIDREYHALWRPKLAHILLPLILAKHYTVQKFEWWVLTRSNAPKFGVAKLLIVVLVSTPDEVSASDHEGIREQRLLSSCFFIKRVSFEKVDWTDGVWAKQHAQYVNIAQFIFNLSDPAHAFRTNVHHTRQVSSKLS